MSPVAMDPQVRAFLAAANASPQPPIETLLIATIREQFASLTPIFHPYVEIARVTDLRTDDGVSLRIYQPPSRLRGPQPGIVYFHGGGWVMGDLETHDTLCRQVAHHASAAVIAVDYRRAPEHPFPAAFDDAFAAVRQVCARASSMGLDATRIAVALKARDAGGPAIAMQCLLYPVLDHGCDSESYCSFATEHGLTAAKMHFFWRAYLAGADGGQPYASPLRAKDLTGLPPAHIITAEYDVLRDEGEAYARRLRNAGVRVELERCAGMIHGFLHYAGAIHHGQRVLKDLGRRLATELGSGRD